MAKRPDASQSNKGLVFTKHKPGSSRYDDSDPYKRIVEQRKTKRTLQYLGASSRKA